MKSLSKFLAVVSIVSFSVFAQAEGVSQDDIERGNNPSAETIELRNSL